MSVACPLCAGTRVFTTRIYRVATLRERWVSAFGFDPFVRTSEPPAELREHRCGGCDLGFFSPEFAADADFFEHFTRRDWYYQEAGWEFTETLRRIRSTAAGARSLLEIGCGKGYFLRQVSGCFDAMGVEINRDAAAFCRANGLVVSTDPLGSISRKFDVIVALGVMQHVSEPRPFLEETVGILLPGGTFIVTVPNPEGLYAEFDQPILDLPPHAVTHWSPGTFQYVAQQFGLKQISMVDEPLRYEHYMEYLRGVQREHAGSRPKSFGARLKKRLHAGVSRALVSSIAPLLYHYHKATLKGLTYMTVFRKES